jgi:hypothetical protein
MTSEAIDTRRDTFAPTLVGTLNILSDRRLRTFHRGRTYPLDRLRGRSLLPRNHRFRRRGRFSRLHAPALRSTNVDRILLLIRLPETRLQVPVMGVLLRSIASAVE